MNLVVGSLVLAVTTVLVSGCGGNSNGKGAQGYANAINLRAVDVGASKGTAPASQRSVSRLLQCAGVNTAEGGSRSESKTFRGPGGKEWWVNSSVDVMPSKAFADVYVAALKTLGGQTCFARDTVGQHVAFYGVEGATTLQTADAGDLPHVGVRLIARIQDPRPNRRIIDSFAFAVGRTVVGLVAQSTEKPPPVAAEQRLLALLVRRAYANRL
jgi:hypothetical protein